MEDRGSADSRQFDSSLRLSAGAMENLSALLLLDEYGNPVQTRTRHVSGDYEMTYAQCDLSGNILESYTEHLDSRGRLSVSESVENTYDRSGRLTRTDYAVNDSLSTDWRYEYDELGRISGKSIDGGLTHAKYRYNLQGWITRIEDVDFVQNLYYESLMGNYGKVRYNGNISAMNWTYRTDTDTIVNGYRFTYDAHDRLASAYSVTGSDFSSGRYHVEYEYDKHGNMVNLYRNGGKGGMIDEMNWSYEGNRVVEITDMVGEQGRYDMKEYRDYNHNGLDYFYDSNGNMTADLDRDIVAIRYNLLNQPDTVQFRNGSAIVNYYTADGKRTGSKYLTPQTTVVIPAGQTFGSTSGTAAMSSHVTARRGSLEYAGADFESDTLIRIHNGDGYLDCSEQDFRYFVRDYQGNIRTVYGSAVAKLIPVEPPFSLTIRGAIGGDKPPIRPTPIEHTVTYQRMQYYPFGLPYEAHYQPEEQPYKYGGKEFIELHGYDSYDFDSRMYYPALCRFMTMDPLCEKYYSVSPYAYCNNNPVKYVDPDGRDWYEYTDKDGNSQTMWRKSQDKIYKDDNGNTWNNIGQNYLSINGDNATLFTQHTNSKGELYLSSSSYNLADEKNANALNSTLGNLLSKGSAVAGSLGGYAEGSNATFRLTNSKGVLDFKFYENGWKGNQWVTPSSISKIGKGVGHFGKLLGGLGVLASAYQFREASTFEGKLEHGLDVFMGGMSFVPVIGTGASLYWSFGGKQLHYKWVNGVLIPQIEMGINPGLPGYQPFK